MVAVASAAEYLSVATWEALTVYVPAAVAEKVVPVRVPASLGFSTKVYLISAMVNICLIFFIIL